MARKSLTEKRKVQALAKGLRDMFRALEQRPAPDELTSLVDQLDDGEAQPGARAKGGRLKLG